MKIVITGSVESKLLLKNISSGINWVSVETVSDFPQHTDADAFFNCNTNSAAENYKDLCAPVFINSPIETLSDNNLSVNVMRYNGLPGFAEKGLWEICGKPDAKSEAVLSALEKKFILVNDLPGFASLRVIAMIINEAFFALEDGVSTKEEIDLAMKLGTNYPFGPFEWSRKIGLKEIYSLLNKMSLANLKYQPSAELKKEAEKL